MKTNQIKDITIPVMVAIGETQLTVESLAELQKGSIIALDSIAGEPVTLLASGEPYAMGEVVIIDENFGIRLTKVLDKD